MILQSFTAKTVLCFDFVNGKNFADTIKYIKITEHTP